MSRSKKKEFEAAQIITAVIGAIAVVIVGYWQFRSPRTSSVTPSPQSIEYVGKILDENDDVVANAKVSLIINGVPLVAYTDSEGVYRFSLLLKQQQVVARVQVTAEGFPFFERNIVIEKGNPHFEDIRIVHTEAPQKPTVIPTTTASPTPAMKEGDILDVERLYPLCVARLLPEDLDPLSNPKAVLQAIRDIENARQWPFVEISSFEEPQNFKLVYWLRLTSKLDSGEFHIGRF